MADRHQMFKLFTKARDSLETINKLVRDIRDTAKVDIITSSDCGTVGFLIKEMSATSLDTFNMCQELMDKANAQT